MQMEGNRRIRRFRRGNINNETILPLVSTQNLTNTVSCLYCDYKSVFFNQPLFLFGRKYSRWLRVWFSMGSGFSLSALVAVTMILLWELSCALHIYSGNMRLSSLLSKSLLSFSSSISVISMSLPDVGYVCISTIISVVIHECGHALAAASEGIQIEYIAVFLAVLFPGALVAFNHELLHVLPRSATFRIYSAGIWHNAAFCAVCALALFLLPLALYPFYTHGESPMVLEVSSDSPLSSYLSPRDLIVSFNGVHIHDVQDWLEMTSGSDLKDSIKVNDMKGYCIPQSLTEKSLSIDFQGNQTVCPNLLSPFAHVSYSDDEIRNIYCFDAKDVVKLQKCGDTHSLCLKDDSCLAPVEIQGQAWVEITYISSSLPKCWNLMRNLYSEDLMKNMTCLHIFVFVGDLKSISQSIYLTSYISRWTSYEWFLHLPNMLERLIMCAFQVSLILALLNSLPVYFLDGESILEVLLQYLTFLTPRKRGIVLRCCLLSGTLSCVIVFLQIFLEIL